MLCFGLPWLLFQYDLKRKVLKDGVWYVVSPERKWGGHRPSCAEPLASHAGRGPLRRHLEALQTNQQFAPIPCKVMGSNIGSKLLFFGVAPERRWLMGPVGHYLRLCCACVGLGLGKV